MKHEDTKKQQLFQGVNTLFGVALIFIARDICTKSIIYIISKTTKKLDFEFRC